MGSRIPQKPGFDRADFEAKKRASVGQLLFKCARLLNERAIERLNRGQPSRVRVAHTALLPHLELEGIRLTELARRHGVSKQATLQLVDELIDMGILERVPDPEDGRAKLIIFTAAGRRGFLTGLAVLAELEAELEARIGGTAMEKLREALPPLLDALSEPAPEPERPRGARGRRKGEK